MKAEISITLSITTVKQDSLEVLADALAGDVVRAAKDVHKVKAKVKSIRVDGKKLKW